MPKSSCEITSENQYLASKHEHPRDAFIQFDEGPHTYTVYGKDIYTSVTTFIHSHFSHFDPEAVISKIVSCKKYHEDPTYKYYGMTRQSIRAMWSQNGQQASLQGTDLHVQIECFMNQEVLDAETMTFYENTTQMDMYTVWMAEWDETGVCLDTEKPKEWLYFLRFVQDFPHFVPYRTEWFIFDEDSHIAGSIDMVYYHPEDNTYSIYDWKRVRSITYENDFQFALTPCIHHVPDSNFWHYSLQLNMYKYILEKKYGIRIRELVLVVLHPDFKTYECIPCAHMQDEIQAVVASFIASKAN